MQNVLASREGEDSTTSSLQERGWTMSKIGKYLQNVKYETSEEKLGQEFMGPFKCYIMQQVHTDQHRLALRRCPVQRYLHYDGVGWCQLSRKKHSKWPL